MAGADLGALAELAASERVAVREAIDASFTTAFQAVMIGTAVLALASAGAGAAIGGARAGRSLPEPITHTRADSRTSKENHGFHGSGSRICADQ